MTQSLQSNSELSHYRIISKLGAGGMGEVWLAEDTKLDRKVALKILPPDVASNKDRMDRFVREAKSAAALNHPNIAHVYEIGETDNTHFIAMEYIDGETLREKIHRDKVSLSKLLKYLTQVASGLAKAHSIGIVHRDLKPDNIMITRDDYAKVLDFGLAKLVEPQRDAEIGGHGDTGTGRVGEDQTIAMSPRLRVSPSSRLPVSHSTPGIVMGTIGYMSPEQASGRTNEIDHRSDIFSFGCILFEAATGKKAFEGKDPLDSLHKIVHAPTPQLKDINPLAPDDLQRVVRRCLAKEPEKRYQSIKEVAIEIDDLQEGLKSLQSDYYTAPASVPVATTSGASRTDEGFWIAVLPFRYRGTNVDLEALADGLTEDIVAGLSRFPYLRVVARSSTLSYTGDSGDVRSTARELGARYVMEGSLRQAGTTIRVSAQLVDAHTGAHLWAETYDRAFQPDEIFAIQDDLIPRIVSTCADHFGVLARSISDSIRGKDHSRVTPYEALMVGFGYHHRLIPEDHAHAREVLQKAVQGDPGNADCWAMLSWIYSHEYAHGYNAQPGSLDRALAAANRAVDLAPSNHFAYQTLAAALFFRKDFSGCLSAAERSMALNPLDASNEAIFIITFCGDWERGCSLIRRAMELNPHHPGWYRVVLGLDEYRKANYRAAVEETIKANARGIFWTNLLLTAAYGQLGELEQAQNALRELLAQKPEFAESAKELIGKWFQPHLVDQLMDGFWKAGLDGKATAGIDTGRASKADQRIDEGFWVAAIPFKSTGSAPELTSLAEGLTEEIVMGLSRFSYLHVIARGSTLRYANHSADLRTVGNELGARYVMEGNLRQAGTKLRVAVQLVDATTGAHLWAQNYERTFSPDAVFELQDDLVPRIVSTVADWYGVLPLSMSEALRSKDASQLTPYEAVLRSFRYYERVTPEEHLVARAALERAVEQAPNNADCWAMLSFMYGEEHRFQFNERPDPLGRALLAARRAVDIAPHNNFAQLAVAQALFFRKEFDSFRTTAERAISLNPMDGAACEYMGHLIAFSGDWERGYEVSEQARKLNPNHPGWYWAVPYYKAYRKGDYQAARAFALKIEMANFICHAMLAAVYAQLGDRDASAQALNDLLRLKPDFPSTGRNDLAKWYLPDLVDQLMDGLLKAGLQEIPNEPKTLRTIRHTVGRETERHELREAFGAAMGGRGSLVCVAGEPGIGKTTLVEDFLAEVSSAHQCTIARGRCSERLAGTEAYLPFLEALQSLLQIHIDFLSPLLKRHAPTWYGQVVPQFGVTDDSFSSFEDIKAASQERMKRELATFLQEASQVQPLILFFDDLHWADISTVDLINFVAAKFDKLKLLIVVTYRPSDMLLVKHPFLQIKLDLQARGVCHELLLEFLSEGEISDYLSLEFPDNRFPSEFAKLIHMKTEGSPLFMADLLRYLRDRKVITETSGAWGLERPLPDIERELPESVRAMIDRKIAQLTDEDRNLLTVAGVQGYEFDSAVISQVLKLEADEVEERLERLERVYTFVQLVSESEFPNRSLTLRYRFIHVLYQNALHHSIRATRKATLSREVALTLEEFYGEKATTIANELAALYETGREWMKAADYFHFAADHASEIFGFQEAIALARRGIQALSSVPDSRERSELELRLQVTLGLSLRSTKGFAHSETGMAYARARELCNQIGDSPQLFSVLFGFWESLQNGGRFKEAMELATEMLEVAGEDPFLLVAAHDVTGDNLMWMGDFRRSREHLEKGIALYDFDLQKSSFARFGYDTGMACLSMDSITLWHLGYSEQGLRMSEESLSLATKLDHPLTLAYATGMAAWFHVLNGSIEKALAFAENGIAICTKYEHSLFLAVAKVIQGWALLRQQKTDQGIAFALQGINFWRDTGTELGTSWITGILAEGYGQAGRFNEALDLCSEALEITAKHGEHFYEAELYRLRGELLLKKEDFSEAEKCFQQALEISHKQSAKRFELRAALSLAGLWQRQHKSTEANHLLGEIYGWFTEGLETPDLQNARTLLRELGKAEKHFTSKPGKGNERGFSELSRDSFGSAINTIAVLPFQNLSADPEQEFFADGITEEIINTLAQISGLRVAGRSSSFSFKGRNEDLRSVGAKLNVATILEGTLRRSGNQLRITAQLIDAATGYQLWSERYDRLMEDVFAVQDEIANKIAGRLQLSLVPDTSQVAPPTKHIRAYELYLKGRGLLYQRGLSIPKAIDCFTQAVSLDPEYAHAWAGLADGYTTSGYSGFNRPVEVMPRALDAAKRALQLDPDLAEAHNAHACASLLYSRDYDLAAREFQRALELSPHYPQARSWYGLFYLHWIAGREQEGRDELFRLLRVDPLSGYANVIFSFSGYTSHRLEEAVEHGRRGVELDPGSYLAQWCLSVALKCSGRYEEAAAAVDRALSLSGRHCWALATLVSIYAGWGKLDKASQGYDELLDRSGREYIQPSMLIEAAAAVEQIDQAIRYAQQALDDRDPLFVLLARLWPAYDPLRNDSRFLGIIEQLSLPNWSIGGQGS